MLGQPTTYIPKALLPVPKFLCAPPSSVPCEQLFSKAGKLVSKNFFFNKNLLKKKKKKRQVHKHLTFATLSYEFYML